MHIKKGNLHQPIWNIFKSCEMQKKALSATFNFRFYKNVCYKKQKFTKLQLLVLHLSRLLRLRLHSDFFFKSTFYPRMEMTRRRNHNLKKGTPYNNFDFSRKHINHLKILEKSLFISHCQKNSIVLFSITTEFQTIWMASFLVDL